MKTITIDTDLARVVPVEATQEMLNACTDGFDVYNKLSYVQMLAAVSDTLPGVVVHSGKPVIWWARGSGAFYLSEESMIRDVKERNLGVVELFTHPPAQPDAEAQSDSKDDLISILRGILPDNDVKVGQLLYAAPPAPANAIAIVQAALEAALTACKSLHSHVSDALIIGDDRAEAGHNTIDACVYAIRAIDPQTIIDAARDK